MAAGPAPASGFDQVAPCLCGRCEDDVARARLAADHAAGTHPAGNRTPDLYTRAKAAAVPLTMIDEPFGMWLYRESAVPWVKDDAHERLTPATSNHDSE